MSQCLAATGPSEAPGGGAVAVDNGRIIFVDDDATEPVE